VTFSQGLPIEFPEIKPWPAMVNGAALLDESAKALKAYVVMNDEQADAISLWSLFTHAFDAFDTAPKLVVKSPRKRSGNTPMNAAP
jgi:hypothetical protein